jgi:hypothetical protein
MNLWRQAYPSSGGKSLTAKHVPICCQSVCEFSYAGEIKTAGGIFIINISEFASLMKQFHPGIHHLICRHLMPPEINADRNLKIR